MRIIPAIDIINGRCVRLTKGNYSTMKTYSDSPVDTAKMFEDNGFKYLHLVDLEGAKAGCPINLKVLEDVARGTNLVVDYGGGLRSEVFVADAFNAGAAAITAGSIAAKDSDEVRRWLSRWGADRILIGADTLDGSIAVDGWQSVNSVDVQQFIGSYLSYGASTFICTDVSRDGMLGGSSLELYKALLASYPLAKLVASGGVSSVQEVRQLRLAGLDGAIIGKAIYEGLIDIGELAKEVL